MTNGMFRQGFDVDGHRGQGGHVARHQIPVRLGQQLCRARTADRDPVTVLGGLRP
jgi:hypothetical protein